MSTIDELLLVYWFCHVGILLLEFDAILNMSPQERPWFTHSQGLFYALMRAEVGIGAVQKVG